MKKTLIFSLSLLMFVSYTFSQNIKKDSKITNKVIPKKMRYYSSIVGFSNGISHVSIQKSDFKIYEGFIDKNGIEVISTTYERTSSWAYKGGLVKVMKDGKWGVVDSHNKLLIPIKHSDIEILDNYYIVSNGFRGILDKKGQEITKLIYSDIKFIGTNLFCVLKDNKWFIINEKQEKIKDLPFGIDSNPTFLGKGLISYKVNDLYGIVDSLGREIIEPKYKNINPYFDGLAQVFTRDFKYIFINENGKEVFRYKCSDSGYGFSEGLLQVEIGYGKWGYIDKVGNQVIEPAFYQASSFSNGLARVSTTGNSQGYINKEGKILFMFDEPSTFHEGLAQVKINGYYAFINTFGKIILDTDISSKPILLSDPNSEIPKQK